MKIWTNNVPRFTIDAWELTPKERAEFDYMDWPAIDQGSDSASFVRYKGGLYDLNEFVRIVPGALQIGFEHGVDEGSPLLAWDYIRTDGYFPATVLRYSGRDHDAVIVGRVTC